MWINMYVHMWMSVIYVSTTIVVYILNKAAFISYQQ